MQRFSSWLGQGGASQAGAYPHLQALRRLDFSRAADQRALSPLLSRLRPEFLEQLANIDSLPASKQKELIEDLEMARGMAGAAASEAVAVALQGEPDWSALQPEVQALSIYGEWAAEVRRTVDARSAAAGARRTEAVAVKIAGRLQGRVLRVEDNVIHVDFKRRDKAPAAAVEATWEEELGRRKPSARLKKTYNDLKRQAGNAEVLLLSDLGKDQSKIAPRLRMELKTAQARISLLERNFPQLKGDFTPAAVGEARTEYGKNIPAEAITEYLKLVAESKELHAYRAQRSASWKHIVRGDLSEYRELKKDPRASLSDSTLEGMWQTKLGEIDLLILKYPGISRAAAAGPGGYEAATFSAEESRSTRFVNRAAMAFLMLLGLSIAATLAGYAYTAVSAFVD